jgi:hypothetical protein
MPFIDAHREEIGIEPICGELAVAPCSYHEHAARLADLGRQTTVPAATTSLARPSSVSTMPALALTARARSGSGYAAKAWQSPSAPWSD